MSAPADRVILDEVPEELAALLDRKGRLRDLAVPAALAFHLDRLADTIGRLRRRHPDPADYDRILLDRAAASVDSLDAILGATAAAYVAAGFEVDEALALVDRHAAELHSRMGGKP